MDWSEIKEDFREGLILGNGASIALHECFTYQSLLKQAGKKHFIEESVKDVFQHLHTKDFERVLRMLWHTSSINKALKIKDVKTRKAYKNLRVALVRTVRSIHPRYTQVSDSLPQIAKFMKRFKMVVSLNYDLLVYWAMLLENTRHQNRFKDCFIHGEFDSEWERYLEPYGSAPRSTLVFYPHGNLALATDFNGSETKLTAGSFSNILDTAISNWQTGAYTPLFVSEGTSKQKVSTIRRSHYLNTVHGSVLPKLGKRLVIFGWSLSNNDSHIVKAICKGGLTEVAVALVTSEPNLEERRAEIKRKINNASNHRSITVIFFDANSRGCWHLP